MAHVLNIKRVANGTRIETGAVKASQSSFAVALADFRRHPDDLTLVIQSATEEQMQGLVSYAKAISLGVDTSSIETALDAII